MRKRSSRGPLLALCALLVVGAIVFVALRMLAESEPSPVGVQTSSNDALEVPASPINAANEGRRVAVSGNLRVVKGAHDTELGVSSDAVQLLRDVRMFQWREDCSSAVCKYTRAWSSKHIDSAGFRKPPGHENPARFPLASAKFAAGDVRLGDFHIDPVLAIDHRAQAGHELVAFPVAIEHLPPNLAATFRNDDGALYAGADPKQPATGDLKVSYRVVDAGAVHLVGRQQGDRLIADATNKRPTR